MSGANAKPDGYEEKEEHGVSIRTRGEIRADERRDRQESTNGWYGRGKAHSAPSRRQPLWRPEWARIADTWVPPDYLKVSAKPQDRATE